MRAFSRPGVLFWLPAFVFASVWLHGATVGPSDDEAFYWALAQSPSLAFAFHPPAVSWSIAAVEWALGWLFPVPAAGTASVALLRLTSALYTAFILALALSWVRAVAHALTFRTVAIVLACAGVFGLSWMIVPDSPLLLGWCLAFRCGWAVAYEGRERDWRILCGLGLGVAWALLGKYSGAAVAASAAASILWAVGLRRAVPALTAIAMGLALAALPIVLWNVRHEWASLLYQVQDRHEGLGLSATRFARFWAIQLVIAGPALLLFSARSLLPFVRAVALGVKSENSRVTAACPPAVFYAWIWALPPLLIYGIQPLFSEFKPHWMIIAWWPLALALAVAPSARLMSRLHVIWGALVIVLVMSVSRWPVLPWVAERLTGQPLAPLMDVSNDMIGWERLGAFLNEKSQALMASGRSKRTAQEMALAPVLGSRYQTAGQAAFALGSIRRATLLPRTRREMSDWPDLGVSDTLGPGWPRLTKPAWFVADHRYRAGPEFPGARCESAGRLETLRGGRVSKWIEAWWCEP